MREFFFMGGHGFYVWTSYGVVVALLVYQYVVPLLKRRKLLAQLAAERERIPHADAKQ